MNVCECLKENENLLILLILIVISIVWGIIFIKYKQAIKKEANKPESEQKEVSPLYIWSLTVLGCVALWIGGAWLTHAWATFFFNEVGENDSNKALFGDSFGAVNALISAFAFAGVIISFIQQKKELELQREELKAQRNEFEAQNKTLALQRFENTFFNMMELQQQIVEGLSYQGERTEFKGREFFMGVLKENWATGDSFNETLERYGIDGYESSSLPSFLDHYFRHLYTILSFIDRADLFIPGKNKEYTADERNKENDKIRYEYAKILRATLSRYELLWLYYNGLSKRGTGLKPLIEKYSMLNNIDPNIIVLSVDVISGVDSHLLPSFQRFLETKQLPYKTDFYYRMSHDEENGKYKVSAFSHNMEEWDKIMDRVSEFKTYLNEWKDLSDEEKRRLIRQGVVL